MKSQNTSKVSYRAALTIFGSIAAIVVLAGLFLTKQTNAANPEKHTSIKIESSRYLSIKDWQTLAK